MTLPPEALTFATRIRDEFGRGVKLLFVLDTVTGETLGRPALDDPRDAPWTPADTVADRMPKPTAAATQHYAYGRRK